MGDAKKRGDFGARKAQSITRRAEEAEARRQAEAAREAAMTPEQRRKRAKARLLMAAILPRTLR
jgi:hypothetical protein